MQDYSFTRKSEGSTYALLFCGMPQAGGGEFGVACHILGFRKLLVIRVFYLLAPGAIVA